jgi:outer membrane protein, heavy metal efflux system
MKSKMTYCLTLGSIVFCQAQDTTYISLDKLLQQIEVNYPSVIQYQYNVQSLQARTEGAKAWMPPTFSTGVMRFPYNLTMVSEKNDPMNQAGIAVSIEQMIPNQRKLNAKRNYLGSLYKIENSKKVWTKNELRREAKISYYNRFVAERKRKIIMESEEILNLLLATAEAKFSNNQSNLQTIYKGRARLAELKNMQFMISGVIAESNIALNSLMVKDVNTVFKIDTLIEPKNYFFLAADTNSVSSRSDIAALSNYIESMKLEQAVMKAGTKPDFGIRADHAQMFGMPNQWSVMGMITIPIAPWSSKMFTTETKSVGFKIQSMEMEKKTMQLMAKKMLAEKLTMLRNESTQYENYKNEIIPAFESNLQANLLSYNQNTGDFFVLLDAWDMLLMKKIEMNDKLFNILKLEAEYEYEKEIR